MESRDGLMYNYEDFTWIPTISYRLCGFDVLDTPNKPRPLWMKLYHWACVCSHICCVCFMFRRIIERDTINNISLIMRYATLVTYVVNSDTKYGTSQQKQAFQRLNGKLAKLFPKSKQSKIDHRVDEYYWPRPTIVLIVVYYGSSAMVVLGPLLQSGYIYLMENRFSYVHCYPYYIFDPEQDPLWQYFLIYALEWLHSTLMVISNMSTDLWLVSFEVQICMHFDYIARSLENYKPNSTRDPKDRKFISQIVNRHNDLLELQEEINGIFGSSLLLSLLTTAGVFCTVAVYTQIQGLNLEGITYVVFMLTASSLVYLVCYYGEKVKSLSTYITNAAYNHNWSDAPPDYKKSLLIIIARAQRPAELTAMGYLPVSLDTFKQVMTVTYRVFALIRQMIE
ncbi:odorant receptor 85f [Drosophila navojoa]|uniref:odorant receptor 85f n=1 Tax=Drosophila navojoa TaxID=7232 RepID=UPI0011BECF20|nr:odorant receptor 85f [Drosophila navojoa]